MNVKSGSLALIKMLVIVTNFLLEELSLTQTLSFFLLLLHNHLFLEE